MQNQPFSANIDAEIGLLGLILWHNSAYVDVATYIEPEDFYRETHQQIYAAMQHLAEKRASLDPIALSEVLERRGVEHINGLSVLSHLYQLQEREMNLIEFDPVSMRAETYANSIARCAEANRLAQAALHVLELARSGVEDATEQAEALVMGVRKRRKRQEFVSLSDYFPRYLDRLDALVENKGNVRGVPTGFDDLDRVLGGLQRGALYVPAARTRVGKTTLCQNFAYLAALKHQKRTAFFSLEMNLDDLMDRFVSIHSKIDSQKLRTGNVGDAEYKLLVGDVMETFERLGIWINHTPGITVDTLKSMARRLIVQHDIDVIIVDYLQLLKVEIGGKRVTPRAEEVAEIARQLKALAGELNVPIVAPAQINREIERRAGSKVAGENYTYKLPMLSDLRESGEIEQSADVVMFLARAEEKEEHVKLYVAKHRNGPEGELDLYFVGSETRFYPIVEGIHA
jgi:replicative DNA helicase